MTVLAMPPPPHQGPAASNSQSAAEKLARLRGHRPPPGISCFLKGHPQSPEISKNNFDLFNSENPPVEERKKDDPNYSPR